MLRIFLRERLIPCCRRCYFCELFVIIGLYTLRTDGRIVCLWGDEKATCRSTFSLLVLSSLVIGMVRIEPLSKPHQREREWQGCLRYCRLGFKETKSISVQMTTFTFRK